MLQDMVRVGLANRGSLETIGSRDGQCCRANNSGRCLMRDIAECSLRYLCVL